jgi:hypothetical protein
MAQWSTIINTSAPKLNIALDTADDVEVIVSVIECRNPSDQCPVTDNSKLVKAKINFSEESYVMQT